MNFFDSYIAGYKYRNSCCVVVMFAIFLCLCFDIKTLAAGEKYSRQGGELSSATKKILIANDFCRSPRECHDLLPSYGEHGNSVHSNYYAISEKNRGAFYAVLNFTVKNGIRITNGIPITIAGYKETHEEYRKLNTFFKKIKPIIVLEVNE